MTKQDNDCSVCGLGSHFHLDEDMPGLVYVDGVGLRTCEEIMLMMEDKEDDDDE